MRIDDLLRRNALQWADRTAVIDSERELTWAELDRESDKLANALLSRGYREQERVAVILTNSVNMPLVFFALWKCNLVSVAVNPRLTGPEIERILEHSGATGVVCESEMAVQSAQAVQATHRRIRDVFSVPELGDGSVPTLASLIEGASEAPVAPRGKGDDLRSIRYTSGTTGLPKGCMATHAQQLASVGNLLVELDIDRDGPMYLAVPLTLGVGAFYLTLCAYAGVPLLIRSKFTAESFRDDLEKYDVRHAFLVPTMLVDLVEDLAQRPPSGDSSLAIVGYGGAAVGWEVVEAVQRSLGCRMYQCLGATELGGMATLFTPADHELMFAQAKKPWPTTPIGRAAAYSQLRILDSDGSPVAPGEVGEIEVRSASSFSGYWGQPEETRSVVRKDGWLALGDMGFTDEFGYVYLADRKQGVIRSGSQNVYAAEVEIVVQSHPSVARAGVVGVPDARYGESVQAYVQLVAGATVTVEEILDYCADKLAGYKRPRFVVFLDVLPVDEGGKVHRGALRAHSQSLQAS